MWQPEDTARFLEHVYDDRLSALYELAAYAGLRRPDRVTVASEQHVAACGLPMVRLHDTRHGAGSLMLAGRGADRDRADGPRPLVARDHATDLRTSDAEERCRTGRQGGGPREAI
jgi:hypothetical protein